jgi:hypothetical protein
MIVQTGKPPPPLLDPYDYDFHKDPYPYYRRLRDEAPLYHNEELGFWALSRHHDVLQGFRNSTTLSNRDGVSLDPVSRGPHAPKTMSFLAMDDPGHLRLRTLASKGFTPRRIRELEPRVTELAVQHLDTMLEKAAPGRAGSETVDYVAEFAGKLPMDVISELMGVPVADRDRIRAMADGVMHREDGVTDVPASAIEASINLILYYRQMIAERRSKPAGDLTSALLEAEIDGDRLTGEEFRQLRAFLPGRPSGPDGSPGGAHRIVQANPRVSGRRGQRRPRSLQQCPRIRPSTHDRGGRLDASLRTTSGSPARCRCRRIVGYRSGYRHRACRPRLSGGPGCTARREVSGDRRGDPRRRRRGHRCAARRHRPRLGQGVRASGRRTAR